MKAGIYCPYLDTLGGGEKYVFDIGGALIDKGWRVDFFWNEDLKKKVNERYGIKLVGVNFIENVFKRKRFIEGFSQRGSYDLFFYVTDGSLLVPPARNSYLVVQSPDHIPSKNAKNILKMSLYKGVICYSEYVKRYIKKEWGKKVYVLAPGVEVEKFKSGEKKKMILSVGRFSKSVHFKKQEVMIEVFKRLGKEIGGYRLILAGGLLREDKEFFEKLEKMAEGEDIFLMANIDFKKLRQLYGQAEIYWHAAGFGEDLNKYPERAEHFGISTLEAMAAGCVCLVFGAGGQKEIVEDGVNGFFWRSEDELLEKTRKVIEKKMGGREMVEAAKKTNEKSGKRNFEDSLFKILCI